MPRKSINQPWMGILIILISALAGEMGWLGMGVVNVGVGIGIGLFLANLMEVYNF